MPREQEGDTFARHTVTSGRDAYVAGRDLHVTLTTRAVRSDYLSQVRRIAPGTLLGRDQELSRLAEFCSALEAGPYLWLRAEAWAGKSALLSSFVLNPPPGIRIISFFITGRLAGQNNRIAFSEVILEQALELIGEPMPTLLTEATRDAHLLGSITRAAGICQQRGERLVLVVDGLDEDQGLTSGPDAHSIAALLPTDPSAGMRVIVAGRPNPPIPLDVPETHPLRQAENIWPLTMSPHANAVRQDTQRELRRLLQGSSVEQDLLGLLSAAGGDLTGEDLAKLTGSSALEIEDHLSTVSGRTFAPRAGLWRPGMTAYVLAHEELQQQAIKFLGVNRISSYRNRLHAWAEEYRVLKWPTDTPEYLLRGYFTLLQVTDDLPRMLRCATDPDRHDRMLDIIGGDNAALIEITSTQEVIARKEPSDLPAMIRLSVQRVKLAERNANIPANLPAVWAQLGRPRRAEALARSITDRYRQAQALAAVAREVAKGGDSGRAEDLGAQAEWMVALVADPYQRAQVTAAVARVASETGNLLRGHRLLSNAEQLIQSFRSRSQQDSGLIAIARVTAALGDSGKAQEIALGIESWSERAQALASVAAEVANSGNWKLGRRIASSISPRPERAQALAAVSRALSAADDMQRAAKIAQKAQVTAHSIRNPARLAWTLAPVAEALARAGLRHEAVTAIGLAEQLAASITKKGDREDTIIALARVAAITIDAEEGERIARGITSPYRKVNAFTAIAAGLAGTGRQAEGESLVNLAEEAARSISLQNHESEALAVLSHAAASAGDIDRAEALAQSISELAARDNALADAVEVAAASGDTEKAASIAASIIDPERRGIALLIVVKAEIASGDLRRAEDVAQSISDPDQFERARFALSGSAGQGRKSQRDQTDPGSRPLSDSDASTVSSGKELILKDLKRVEVFAHQIENPYTQFKQLSNAAHKAIAAGDLVRAEEIIGLIAHPQLRIRGLIAILEIPGAPSDGKRARRLVDEALRVFRSITRPALREQAANEIAQLLVKTGNENLLTEITDSIDHSADVLTVAAVTLAQIGNLEQAEKILHGIPENSRREKALELVVRAAAGPRALKKAEGIARSIVTPSLQSRALSSVAQSLLECGDPKGAETVAKSISDHLVQTGSLTVIASALPVSEAGRILADALMVGDWRICLKELIRVQPDAIEVIASEFLPQVRPPTLSA